MRHSVETGFSFGLTSGVITTPGLIVGLHSSTYFKPAVIGGVLTMAIADAFSDALGFIFPRRPRTSIRQKKYGEATISAFMAKFFFALTFLARFSSSALIRRSR